MDALAGYEKIHSVIGVIIVTIVALVIIAIAIHLLLAPVRKDSVQGKVQSYDPNTKQSTIAYTVGENTYYLKSGTQMGVGNTVLVLYQKENPNNARLSTQISNKTLAIIMIIGALIVTGLVYVNAYFVFKSKQYATVAGGLDIANQVSNMLNR